ncbi:MAG: c-type cytochrome [Deltaproteobacteria bacterium]|nr:c-type cytochrome [Deltaproteobacteria bacterium]
MKKMRGKWLALAMVTGLTGLVWAAAPAGAAGPDGAALFRSLHCAGCHKLSGRGVGISAQEMAQGYAGRREALLEFLGGAGQPLLMPDKAMRMARQLKETHKLSTADLNALVDYILAQK